MAMKMLLMYCCLAVLIGTAFGADENCTSDSVLTEIDNVKTDMPIEDQKYVIEVVKNATIEGGKSKDIIQYIIDTLAPTFDQKKEWTVIKLPALARYWYDSKIYITACRCKKCTKYLVYYVTHDEVDK